MTMLYPARQIFAYAILSTFLVFVLFYGFADSLSKMDLMGSRKSWGMFDTLEIQKAKICRNLTILSTANLFDTDDPSKRVLIVGDVHGMMTSLEKLLKRVKYSPLQDVLLHVGDIVSKGSLNGSLAVLQFMASNNIAGVRGNHDQLVIEWKNWYKWVSTCPGGKEWLDRLQAQWEKAQASDPDVELETWLRKQKKASTRKDKFWWKLIPNSWIILDDHYSIAKDMTDLHFQYLLDLPLRLYIPSAHTFIVHAGLLPSDPRYPVDDKARQPLARMPILTRQSADNHSSINETLSEDGNVNSTSIVSNKTIEALRNLQETGILTQIPQNTDPWVVLNMRSVLGNGKISKKPSGGMPWSTMWKQHMESCNGYKRELSARQDTDDVDDVADDPTPNDADSLGIKKYNLLCYPSTTVYGHAAGRRLDMKRWSFGLDSGCIYGRKLSALVIKGQSKSSRDISSIQDGIKLRIDEDSNEPENSDDDDEDEDDDEVDQPGNVTVSKNKNKNTWLPFGDSHRAKVITVRCHA
ncbi:hypothetical protein CVT25_006050 [Psilocybe cyanescens]|uniref:Calcineurin-like phosphoesterase domain-containing protein n=1 Tax=Psilocybe cyanescens TaxID=93625 RepID=A0A409VMN4_PSICY|nr:hypothetical protein CVT25_006050 [Psilocybe cyanescens]